MLYLAQVQKKGILGKAGLRLLARQRSEHTWTVLNDDELVLVAEPAQFNEGALVLIELTSNRQVLSVNDAKEWVLELVQKFLLTGITPAFLQQETERAEQWRQSLTLQSQELDRRALELEARKEQIQVMEEALKREKESLKREKTLLDSMMAQSKLNPSN